MPKRSRPPRRNLEATLKLCARTIHQKYLLPPETTDFGILFLATEGLYAEALRRIGLAETLQREYRVILTGPNTFAAILNSLQMGFRTLEIQRKSSEVWETLSRGEDGVRQICGSSGQSEKEDCRRPATRSRRRKFSTRALQRRLLKVESAPDLFEEPADEPFALDAGD